MRRSLRRYPALGFLAAAALLASLLPSALRVPLSGPSSSAELAPVPGKSDAAQGDLSALGETSTGGLGSGGGTDGPGGGGRNGKGTRRPNDDGSGGGAPDGGGGRNPTQKRCVGNPPRQTEDPLSPPCVAYFNGDNGGATSKGVTRDDIAFVVNHWDPDCPSSTEIFDYDDDDPREDPAVDAYVEFFNTRFQLYGRRVHVYGAEAPCGNGRDNEHFRTMLHDVEDRLHPFAGDLGVDWNQSLLLELARVGTFTFSNSGIGVTGLKRSVTISGAPFVLSYTPDHDDVVAGAAEFVCARLAGRTARFAGDPVLRSQKRKFGLVYRYDPDDTGDGIRWFVDRVRQRCGDEAGEIVVGDEPERQRVEGVTTAVAFGEDGLGAAQAAAQGWSPEWFLVDNGDLGNNSNGRLMWNPPLAGSVFGMASVRRLLAPVQQPHRIAFAEGCGCSDPPPVGALNRYNTLLLLFTGIQAAGPKLTPANVDRGLHAIPARRSLDPFTPAAYFAPGNYSFVKDWLVTWWDPSGRPPGTNTVGCWRLVEDGLRYRVEDWAQRPGDDDIQRRSPEQACQGDAG